jgi:hypothetical protein
MLLVSEDTFYTKGQGSSFSTVFFLFFPDDREGAFAEMLVPVCLPDYTVSHTLRQ